MPPASVSIRFSAENFHLSNQTVSATSIAHLLTQFYLLTSLFPAPDMVWSSYSAENYQSASSDSVCTFSSEHFVNISLVYFTVFLLQTLSGPHFQLKIFHPLHQTLSAPSLSSISSTSHLIPSPVFESRP